MDSSNVNDKIYVPQKSISETCWPFTFYKMCLILQEDFQSTDVDLTSKSDERPAAAQHRLQPLLGYDWIAGQPG